MNHSPLTLVVSVRLSTIPSTILTVFPSANVNSKGNESGKSVSASNAETTASDSALNVGPMTAPLGANLSTVCERGSANCLHARSHLALECAS